MWGLEALDNGTYSSIRVVSAQLLGPAASHRAADSCKYTPNLSAGINTYMHQDTRL